MYVAYGCADSTGCAFRTACVAHFGGVLSAGRFVVASVLSCLQGVSVKVDHLSDPS